MTQQSKPTCGYFYKTALATFTNGDDFSVRTFAAGFVCGQAEKVYLGACRAAMFRPSDDRREMILAAVRAIASLYDLSVVEPIGTNMEIWICKPKNSSLVMELHFMREDTKEWHMHRAMLCGIPDGEVDLEFHLRQGHGQRCD